MNPPSLLGKRQTHLAMATCSLGVALFAVMDATMKGASLQVGVYNALLWRSVMGTVIGTGLWLIWRLPVPGRQAMRLHAIRGILVAAMAYTFFWALVRLPLAEAIALSFIAPLVALYLAAVFLKEQVGREAIIASTLCLAGVLLIVSGRVVGHYDARAALGAIAVLVSALLYAGNLVIQRRQAQMAGAMEIAISQNIMMLVAFLPAAPFLARIPQVAALPLLMASAILSFVSLALIAWAYAREEAQRLIPLEYTAFLWSALAGWVAFHEAVSITTLGGAALIICGSIIAARGNRTPAHIESTIA